jgi:threonylcarbamoyladenosine tRNA methylthiotransferase MtaB
MKRASIITLGCRFNQSESDAMLGLLKEAGYLPEKDPEQADVVVVNTCAVTTESERKSRKLTRWAVRGRRRHPGRIVVVTGCYANLAPEEAAALQPDLVLGNSEKGHLAEWIARAERERSKPMIQVIPAERQPTLQELPPYPPQIRTRAFLRIQDGCRRGCSYCIIPLFRGQERSLEPEAVLQALRDLDRNGVPEAVLTGIHLASWGRDLTPRKTIEDLARAIADSPLNLRVRWSSVEPEETSPAFLRVILQNLHRFCPHFHLPVQSGSNRILRQMKRGYTRERYIKLLECAREIHPMTAFTTDVIVGFPGETDADFEETLNLIEECRFARVHAFPYAPRPGTPAARMETLPPRTLRKRMTRLLLRAESIRREVLLSYLGLTHSVLIESEETERRGEYRGYSEYYLPAVVQADHAVAGEIVRGTATGICGNFLIVQPAVPLRPVPMTLSNSFRSVVTNNGLS